MSICPACNGTGPLGAVLGVVCGRCDGSGEVCDAAAQAETKGGETMNDEMMAHTFVVESMTVEAGRIIPSPALAEAVIGGIAQIIAERDELRAECDRLRNINQTYEAENRVQRAERDAAQAEAARYKALWDSVPREAINMTIGGFTLMVEEFGYKLHPDDAKMVDVMLTHAVLLGNWYRANAAHEQEPQP